MNVNSNRGRNANFFNAGMTSHRLANEHSRTNAMRGNRLDGGAQNAQGMSKNVRISGSLIEINRIQQDFVRQLTGDDSVATKSSEQLLSEIYENFKGEERAKRIAALEVAVTLVDVETHDTDNLNAWRTSFSDGDTSAFERITESGYLFFDGRHFTDPTLSTSTNEREFNKLSSFFDTALSMSWNAGGSGNFMSEFERIRSELKANLSGDELAARLDALESSFLRMGEAFATFAAIGLMRESPDYTEESDSVSLTRLQRLANARLEQEANNFIAHISGMFRVALDFFNATGSFVGVFDIAETNVTDALPLRGVDELVDRFR
jgi:hypothetical protein